MSEAPDIDADLLAKLNGGNSSAADDGGHDVDAGLLAKLNAPLSSDKTSHPGAKHDPVAAHHNPPTRFQQSVAPTPEPEMSWGDVGKSALHNALPSLGGAGKAMLDTVLHPIKTATALGDIGKGGVSQLAGVLGMQQDPTTKAHNEALISALENHYKTAYGSVKGFKKALAEDPASVALDASTLLSGGAGAIGKLGGMTKTAAVLNKVASAVDPVANAVRVAKLPGKLIAPVARQASSLTTGVPASALKLAAQVGAHADPAVRAAYTRFVTGQGDATEFQRAAQGAVNAIKKDRSDAYLAQKGPMASKPVDLTNSRQALADAEQKAKMGSTVGPVPDAAMKAINDAKAMVDNVAADPTRSTIEHVDALKQQMWNLKNFHPDLADNYLNGIYHGVKADLVGADPEYASLMEKYQDASQNINDLSKTLIGGKNPAASATLLKNMRAMKTGTGENLLGQIMARDPTIGGMLAGQALHPWHAGGRSAFEALLSVPAAGAIFSHPMAAAAAIPASLLSSSPRVAGAVSYGAGAAERLAKTKPIYSKGAYYAGRAEEEGAGDEPNPPGDLMTQAKAAVSGIESGGNYDAIGPAVHGGDHAIGKYQVMASNIPKWTAQALGKSMTPEEFKADPDAQEKVFETIFGGYLQKYGNVKDAMSAWHSGVPLDQAVAENRHDVNMSTADYVDNGMGRMGRATGGKTTMTHEQLVERLMKLARAAKRHENGNTETLLNVPDAVVVKALEVAQAAI
jgi:hypothetical protein